MLCSTATAESPSVSSGLPGFEDLSPERRYAGEILGYLLKIVMGVSGNPAYRKDWRTRGLGVPLPRFFEVQEIMRDASRNELTLMVLDPDLRFLTRVLYHYDPRLSLYKGSVGSGVYPAPEFVALRLLLLHKVERGEKIRLGEVVRRRTVLEGREDEVTERDLEAMGLRVRELDLIQAILESEPHLFAYLHSPFLVRALWEVGAVEGDAFVNRRMKEARYDDLACRWPSAEKEGTREVRIALLPSLTTEFETPGGEGLSGLVPSDELEKMCRALQEEIRASVAELDVSHSGGGTSKEGETDARVSFCFVGDRPLVIHPENAEEVIRDICPNADFTIILTDKNLYLPMHVDEGRDVYPYVPRFYLDMLELRYGQAGDRIQEIARFVRSRLFMPGRTGEEHP